jgi:diguanylate cyclase (GGDEF)-like protein/hemerythrin-like metal-binding protein
VHQIVWKSELSVGIESIDNDHKELIAITNKLLQEVDKGSSRAHLEKHFEELEAYTHYHFRREEKLMAEKCQTELERERVREHIREHHYFIEQIPLLKEKLFASSSRAVSFEVIDFLAHWLLEHIISKDLLLAQCSVDFDTRKEQKKHSLLEKVVTRLNDRLSLTKRAFLIVAVPLVTILLISGYLSYSAYAKYHEYDKIEKISRSFISINLMINSLQKERGLSNGYIRSSHKIFAKELKTQRIEANRFLEDCRSSLKKLRHYVDTAACLNDLEKLKEIRSRINTGDIDPKQSLEYYTRLIEELIDVIKMTSHLHTEDAGEDSRAPLLVLLHLNENIALLRSEGISILQGKTDDLNHFQRLLIRGEAYLKSFKILATDALRKEVENVERSESSQRLRELRMTMLKMDAQNSNDTVVYLWYRDVTKKIDQYEVIIENILHRINEKAIALKSAEILYITILWTALLAIILLTFLISYALKQSIIEPIISLTKAMQDLARGNKRFYFNRFQSDDVIGKMINAYNDLRKSLIKAEYSRVLLEVQEQKAENLEKIAYMDPLTNALNRRRYEEIFREKIFEAHKSTTPLSIMMLDLDRFKAVNDTFGHEIGDHVLKKFSDLIHHTIRTNDTFARIGGEEFSLLLTGSSRDDTLKLAERIRRGVEEMDLSFLSKNLTLTVSIGIAFYQEGATMESMMREADKKLYQAKKEGRNRVSA